MAPLYKTAAAFCLVGLFGLQAVAATEPKYKFVAEDVEDKAYLAVKLARNGKISAKINAVEVDNETVTALKGKKKIFHQSFDSTTAADYPTLVQKALETGLAKFSNKYPENQEAWKPIWQQDAAVSVMHLLGETSTKVGCVIAKCAIASGEADEPNQAVLFCELSPAATENAAAFSEEYFKELIARETKIKDMTEEDLKDPVVTSSASAAVPSILTAGLVAILAAISA